MTKASDELTSLAHSDVKVAEKHPELHHYTQWTGLKGIWESQQLWAVRYSELNDPTEFKYVKGLLAKAMTPEAISFVEARRKSSSRFDRAVREGGG